MASLDVGLKQGVPCYRVKTPNPASSASCSAAHGIIWAYIGVI